MRRLALLAAATGLIATGTVIAQPMPPGPPPGAPQAPGMGPAMGAMSTSDYVAHAARTDMFEIAEARLALGRSHNPHVRQFAQMMIADHTKSTNMIKAALHQSGHTPPPPMLGPEQQRLMGDLRASGPNFDRTYIDQQVQGHQKALQLHQAYAGGGDDPALRRTARMIVPVVQRHLAMAQDIQGHIG